MPVLFTDDSSIFMSFPDSEYFQNSITDIFADLNRLLKVNIHYILTRLIL
jgi:hypothetical protein